MQKQTSTDYLYYTGGSALNIIVNSAIIRNNIFRDVFIPPCTNDTGLAIGAAAFIQWQNKINIKRHSPYLNNIGIEDYRVNYTIEDIKKIAELLIQKKVIAVCNGYGEVGPRALGNRSILSLANSKELSKKVSMYHKGREWYRPIAPVMLEKNAKRITGLKKIHHLSEYMLLEFFIPMENRKEIQGAVHINGTARIQTIFSKKSNSFIFDLLTYLDKIHGVTSLINTSFNYKGKPIVHTKDDALLAVNQMNLDALIFNGKIIYQK